jgi:hypothetical protein
LAQPELHMARAARVAILAAPAAQLVLIRYLLDLYCSRLAIVAMTICRAPRRRHDPTGVIVLCQVKKRLNKTNFNN